MEDVKIPPTTKTTKSFFSKNWPIKTAVVEEGIRSGKYNLLLRCSCAVCLFVCATFVLYLLLPADGPEIHFPHSLTDCSKLSTILKGYQSTHGVQVGVLFLYGYIYKQTFSVPGSFFFESIGRCFLSIIHSISSRLPFDVDRIHVLLLFK